MARPRRVNKYTRQARPLSYGLDSRKETRRGEAFVVRQISAQRAVKSYICPGCDRHILPGVAHVVVWPDVPPIGSSSVVEHRRHWHSSCWARP